MPYEWRSLFLDEKQINSLQIDRIWKCKHYDVKVRQVAAGATKLIYTIEISTDLYYYLSVCVLDDQAESEKRTIMA